MFNMADEPNYSKREQLLSRLFNSPPSLFTFRYVSAPFFWKFFTSSRKRHLFPRLLSCNSFFHKIRNNLSFFWSKVIFSVTRNTKFQKAVSILLVPTSTLKSPLKIIGNTSTGFAFAKICFPKFLLKPLMNSIVSWVLTPIKVITSHITIKSITTSFTRRVGDKFFRTLPTKMVFSH